METIKIDAKILRDKIEGNPDRNFLEYRKLNKLLMLSGGSKFVKFVDMLTGKKIGVYRKIDLEIVDKNSELIELRLYDARRNNYVSTVDFIYKNYSTEEKMLRILFDKKPVSRKVYRHGVIRRIRRFINLSKRNKWYKKIIFMCERLTELMKKERCVAYSRLSLEDIKAIKENAIGKTPSPLLELKLAHTYLVDKHVTLKQDIINRQNKVRGKQHGKRKQ